MLYLICDKNKAIIADTHKKYPDVDVCFAFRDVLGKNDIDWVVLTTPVETHFPMAPEVLLSRKHVYVEKPLELEEKETKLLISPAGERSKVLRTPATKEMAYYRLSRGINRIEISLNRYNSLIEDK